MPTEWVIAGMVSIIGTLGTAIAILWRNHLASDQRERDRADQANSRLGEMVEILKKAAKK